ncbi:MAG: sulfotransferase [Chitinophagaceae bacterium]
MPEVPTILYIISDKRSGSTLLENILSKSNEAVSLGEVAMLKNHVLKEGPGEKWGWNCSCGEALSACPFWSPVLQKVLSGQNSKEFETKINWPYTSLKALAFGVSPNFFKKKIFQKIRSQKANKIVENVFAVYQAVFELTGKNFIIDSSKLPIQALALYQRKKEIPMKFIFLTRDIRGIAYSKKKSKESKEIKISLKDLYKAWVYKKFAAGVLKYILKKDIISIRYEQLAEKTGEELEKIFSFTGMRTFETPAYMELLDDHTLGGTPKRFDKREIRLDASWEKYFNNHHAKNLAGKIFNKT